MWIVGRERNSRIFENKDSSVPQLKSQLKEKFISIEPGFLSFP